VSKNRGLEAPESVEAGIEDELVGADRGGGVAAAGVFAAGHRFARRLRLTAVAASSSWN